MAILILEGADCSGKTTLANQLLERFHKAVYVHFNDFKNVKKSLARIYVEAAMPAIIGYRPVIMDRSWLSELPYGKVYRPHQSLRVDCADIRMLERLFLTFNTTVIYCDPGWQKVKKCFSERVGNEYLDNIKQLSHVRQMYHCSMNQTHLPVHVYNWITDDLTQLMDLFAHELSDDTRNTSSSDLWWKRRLAGVGSTNPQVLIVGDGFASHKEFDPFYQWPFASFSNRGCSRWLATQLDKQQIAEHQLRWVNQDQLSEDQLNMMLKFSPRLHTIIGLGNYAWKLLNSFDVGDVKLEKFSHPQWWKRFNVDKPYDLAERLKELTNV